MTEHEIKITNIIKAICVPFIYNFIMIIVSAVFDIVLFFRQVSDMNGYANFRASYTYMETLNNNMKKYSYMITFISALIAIIVFGIVYVLQIERENKGGFIEEIKYNNYKMLGFIVILGVFGSLGLSRFVSMLPLDNVIGNYKQTSENLLGGSFAVQIISIGIIVPIAEEIIYRGILYNRLKKLISPVYAMVLAAAMFGVFHFNLLQGTYAFLIGLLLTCVYIKCQSITAPILMHSVANITAIIAGSTGISEFFSRNIFGYIVIMIIELIIGCIFLELIINDNE